VQVPVRVDERPIPTTTTVGEPADPLLSIGVFARRSRLSPKALRLYERLGVLRPAHVDRDNGYRRYRQSQLATARLVAMLRRLDMPLEQVAEVVAAVGPRGAEVAMLGPRDTSPAPAQVAAGASAPDPRGAALVAAYWEGVERRVASQRELAAHLRIRLSGGEGRLGMFEIREREVPEQVVLTEQRHVRVRELQRWLPEAMGRLVQTAQGAGGMAGAVFVVYHGEVNEDSDGPVEVCVPVGPAEGTAPGTATRREPAHREAYARLTKAQVEFPQILTAYDAVIEWVGAHGRSVAGAPREVYFADWDAAGPTDEVCDVALPVG
jgi:DNA-binding transcriptional MerR regulator